MNVILQFNSLFFLLDQKETKNQSASWRTTPTYSLAGSSQ